MSKSSFYTQNTLNLGTSTMNCLKRKKDFNLLLVSGTVKQWLCVCVKSTCTMYI